MIVVWRQYNRWFWGGDGFPWRRTYLAF